MSEERSISSIQYLSYICVPLDASLQRNMSKYVSNWVHTVLRLGHLRLFPRDVDITKCITNNRNGLGMCLMLSLGLFVEEVNGWSHEIIAFYPGRILGSWYCCRQSGLLCTPYFEPNTLQLISTECYCTSNNRLLSEQILLTWHKLLHSILQAHCGFTVNRIYSDCCRHAGYKLMWLCLLDWSCHFDLINV